jgi:hypothetical protein
MVYKSLLNQSQKIDRVFQLQYLQQQQQVARLKAEKVKRDNLAQEAKVAYLSFVETLTGLYKGSLVPFDAVVYEKNLSTASQLHEQWSACEQDCQLMNAQLAQALDHLVVQNRKIEHLGEKIKSFRLLSNGIN